MIMTYDKLQEVAGTQLVVFSKFKTIKNGQHGIMGQTWIVDAPLGEVPIQGKVKFINHDPSWCETFYTSKVVESPTWEDISLLATEMIAITGDRHHCFLENISIVGEEDGIKIVEFVMGS